MTKAIATAVLSVTLLSHPASAEQEAPVVSALRWKQPKHGNWYPNPPKPGSSRGFDAFDVTFQSGHRAARYYPVPVSPGVPPDNEFYDDVYAVITLYRVVSGGHEVAGDLVFFGGEDIPVNDLLMPNRVVLFFTRADFAPVLELLRAKRSGVITIFEPCEHTGDLGACYAVGQLRFPPSPMVAGSPKKK